MLIQHWNLGPGLGKGREAWDGVDAERSGQVDRFSGGLRVRVASAPPWIMASTAVTTLTRR
jgi:hypothetical protein